MQLAGPPGHFDPADLSTSAGDAVFFLDNTSPGTHSFAIGPSLGQIVAASATVMSGQAAVFTVHDLQAGHYITWCTIGNHAAEGMVGTLIVK
jgi:plastocyanin